MKASRRTALVALFLWGTHVFVLASVHANTIRVLLSNSFQFAIGILALLACILAARRSGAFGRTFWRLAAAAFSVLVVGLGLNTYNDSFSAFPVRHFWLIDLFTNAWMAPLAMCLFLDPDGESDETDWRRFLDFSQVGIVFVLLYLYSSNFAIPGEGFQSWRLALVTDGLITMGFFARGATTGAPSIRTVFWQFGCFRLVAAVTDLVFLLGTPEPQAGIWFDAIWSITTLIPVLIASGWDDPEQTRNVKSGPIPYRRLLVTQLMPLIFPVLIILMASYVARRQLILAATAVLLSLAITYARLILAQREQQTSADALRRSHHLLNSIMEGANETIFIKDERRRYLMINTPGAHMIGRSVEEVIGKKDSDFFPPDAAQRLEDADEQVMLSGKPMTYELTTQLPHRDVCTFLTTTAPHMGPSGTVKGLIGISLDVTDRRKLEEELRQSQKMEAIGTLSGGVAHDFNNLLTVIKGYTGLLLDGTKHKRLEGYLHQVNEATDRAISLTRQLLAFSRRQVLQPRIIDVNHLVVNLGEMLQRLVPENIEMKILITPNIGTIKADPGQIEQVIMNLVVNARDAMPVGGTLTIKTASLHINEKHTGQDEEMPPGDYVTLTVTDCGVGMDSWTRAHIFEPFFTTKERGRGTGLGLSMVYGIVKQSGGSIRVESEPGRGTAFEIYLPIVETVANKLQNEQSVRRC